MSEQGEQRTPAEEAQAAAAADEANAQATRVEGAARVEEVQRNVADADVRRVEEEREEAEQKLEKLSRKERKAKEKAEKEAAEALEARAKAQEAERLAHEAQRHAPTIAERPTQTSTASVTSPGVGSPERPARRRGCRRARPPAVTAAPAAPSAMERPEVLVGAAFAGAFLLARLIRAATSSDD